ncbi:MAG: 4-(cytidine 5'-diphospho)-2-C-methyl-D-erythritol kinase [Bacteroidales bacterium]|jgi:4-diphosphocytidyl-2-C-methyl-D-erythritol kinase|nr:4-(cytidine 5'-diphospho)-2-C-methyl-D-erythritol kinase [Bacteroidales bacterium]MCI2121749.1 4-(cytidine 5'-diphospho)-2-C-methyl-D-erythritol kinase [Bacteroidales bacterium]MCI2146362.1 4-(cytidine 5'-diphospho)-2-C-methyl-D-erythritol kinase [Bacteroidales bacterium]
MVTYPNAKINLGLRVFGVRGDGYHDIETAFYPCRTLRDILEIVPSHDSSTHVTTYGLPLGENASQTIPEHDNICYKAWKVMNERYGIGPVELYLYKNIPSGAGLGGGSADGAFTLRMISEIFRIGLSPEELAGLASILGSDCAFFIHNRPMLARGRGEMLEPVDIDLSEYDIRIVSSPIHVSTTEAYRCVASRPAAATAGKTTLITGDSSRSQIEPLNEILESPPETWRGILSNDFEPSVFAAHPELAQTKRQLYKEGAVYAAMSGSGSAIFGLFRKYKK